VLAVKELLDAGVHFGHPMNKWNPKMARYIFGERSNIYVLDLQKTIKKLDNACTFVRNLVAAGQSVLFVGTKRQAQAVIEEAATRAGMFYINQRWLGGMLTNFTTIRKSVDRLKKIEQFSKDGTYERLPKKEITQLEKERGKLLKNLAGIRDMNQLPGAVFIVDTVKERTCVAESNRLKIPLIAMVDTNSDPDGIDYPIPGNDDGTRSIRIITNSLVDAILEGVLMRTVAATAVTTPASAPTIATPVERVSSVAGLVAAEAV
jgi:small subunit ribosomal protein S2